MNLLLLLSVCFLAYSNGANDNFKGVASLFGSKTTGYRTAIGWATVCTFAGSVAAILLAQSLLSKFSGKGLVPDALVGSEYFVLAVAVGAGATVILATITGFPISTTHALTGAMVGSGWIAVGSTQVQVGVLGRAFVLPLLLSPLVALALGASVYVVLRWLRLRLGITKEWCICVGEEQQFMPMPQPSSLLALQAVAPVVSASVDEQSRCVQRYAGRFLGIGCHQAMDVAHFLSAGVVSFARGVNDTPKMAALLVLPAFGARWSLVAVALAIAVGGLLGAQRVAETMSHKITGMNHGQGFSANLATGLLVTTASLFGLPVSTTHVSVGSLFGIGLMGRQADLQVVRNILLSWLVTLPCAAVVGALAYWLTTL